jgi:aryl-alcohol dehydrogenase-like predicted oxidoreductase
MITRTLGLNGPDVSAIGLGCMGMSFAYGEYPQAASIKAIHHALDVGMTHLDTAEVYGPFANEQLLGEALAGRRDEAFVATKFGFNIQPDGQGGFTQSGVNSHPDHIRTVVEASLKRLKTDRIDLLYQHRVDMSVPIEEVVGVMADLVAQGKVLHLGLSEPSAATLRRACLVHQIAAVQIEYSLWTRGPEVEMLPTCAELGVGFVPYSPLGRGFLTGKLTADAMGEKDFRRSLPRYSDDAMAANRPLVVELERIAAQKDCTAAQLALAWLLAQGPHIIPIPGARRIANIDDNAAASAISLTECELNAIAAAVPENEVQGKRYNDDQLAMTNL